MQLAPTAQDQEVTIDNDSISMLLDKRSELMKRGRVKRVFYKVEDEVINQDMRGEIADLEELEE